MIFSLLASSVSVPPLVANRVQHLSMDGGVFGPDGGESVVLLADVTADT